MPTAVSWKSALASEERLLCGPPQVRVGIIRQSALCLLCRARHNRHLAAINLVRAGMDLPSIKSYLGHRNLISTLRYAEYADDTAATRAARLLDALRANAQAQTS